MEIFWISFAIFVASAIINIVVLNYHIQQSKKLKLFVDAAGLYVSAYTVMVAKYNEVVAGFNEMKVVIDNQADVISTLLRSPLTYLERPTGAKTKRSAPKDQSTESTGTE